MARTKSQNEAIREKSKQQILDAAFELFAKVGFSSTSINGIAQKAGISKGLIYHYFGSKDEILVSIFEQMNQVSDDIFSQPEGMTAEAKFRKMLDLIFRYMQDHPELMRLLISLALQPDAVKSVKPFIEESNKSQMQIMTHILNELGHANSENEALYIGAKLDGIVMGFLTLGEDYPLEDIKQKLVSEYV